MVFTDVTTVETVAVDAGAGAGAEAASTSAEKVNAAAIRSTRPALRIMFTMPGADV